MKALWRKYLETRAPRYTSYPSALQFNESVNGERYAERLKAVSLYQPLSLYVHVPFCRQLCWYCGCNMRVENSYARTRYYLDALVEEIRMVGGLLNGAGRPVNVHFGGGTPNFLLADDLKRILDAVEMELGLTDDARLAIELDPRLIRDDDMLRLAALGFSRMSLGVQDLDPEVQQAINRVQSFDLIEDCVSLMRQAGVNDLAFDILYGLPKQTPRKFAATIGKVIALSPDRFSVFGYAHLPAALPRQRLIDATDIPDKVMRRELADIADDMLVAAGYVRIGFDHYAKPDNPLAAAAREKRLRRNFQGFTDDIAETCIGFGASAISFAGGLYAQNARSIRDYCAAVASRRLPTARGVARTARDAAAARAIERLLCEFETEIADVLAFSRPEEKERMMRALEAFEKDDVIRRDGSRIFINARARSLCRAVAAAIDSYVYAARPLADAV